MNSVIVWFRKDLRLSDNPALVWAVEYANTQSMALIPLFIDSDGDESPWSLGGASRVWLHESLKSLQTSLEALGSTLILRKGPAVDVLKQVAKETDARAICWNRRYEPAIIERDQKIKSYFGSQNIEARSFNGSLLREPWEIQNKQGKPFQVYTPFYKTLSASLDEISDPLKIPSKIPVSSKFPQSDSLASLQLLPKISWHESIQKNWTVAESSAQIQLNNFLNQPILTYSEARNRPAVHGTSRLSPYLHWGQISPRQIWNQIRSKYRQPKEGVEVYSKEIIWREFAYHLLFHFPHTPAKPLRAEFELFPWKVNSPHWNHWIQGLTGYPIVDAGMRELWTTGWMHNRVRMIVASFLVKDLLIPWQEGAKWFWDTLGMWG
jgi:deoxyribodipyrimidine photo-lyase